MAGCGAPAQEDAPPASTSSTEPEPQDPDTPAEPIPMATAVAFHGCVVRLYSIPVSWEEAKATLPAGYAPSAYTAGTEGALADLVTAGVACKEARAGNATWADAEFVVPMVSIVPPAEFRSSNASNHLFPLEVMVKTPGLRELFQGWGYGGVEATLQQASTSQGPATSNVVTAESSTFALRLEGEAASPEALVPYIVRQVVPSEQGTAVVDVHLLQGTTTLGDARMEWTKGSPFTAQRGPGVSVRYDWPADAGSMVFRVA